MSFDHSLPASLDRVSCCKRRQAAASTAASSSGVFRHPPLSPDRVVYSGNGIAKKKFKTLVRRVIHLLRLRRRWAAYGRILQHPPRSLLWEGLERKKGKLVRVAAATAEPKK